MYSRRPVTVILFAVFTLVFCLGNRPDCDRRAPTITTCTDMNITIDPGTCVEISNPCDPSGDFDRVDGFRLCDAPDGIFVTTSRSRSGTTRQICAAADVETLNNAQATYIYATPGNFGEAGITISTTAAPPPLTVSVSASSTSITSGDSVDLDGSASGGVGPYSYSWSSNPLGQIDGASASLEDPTVSPTTDVTYTLTVTDANGDTASDSVFIAVAPPPPLDLSVEISASPGTTINEGDSVTLTANASGGDGSYAFVWSTGDSGSSITVTPAVGDTDYTVTVSDGAGTTPASDTITVTVLAAPPGLEACFTWDNDPALGVTTTFDSACSSSGLTCITWHIEFQLVPGDPSGWFTEAADDGCGVLFGGPKGVVNATFAHTWTEAPEPVPHRMTLIVDDGTGTFASVTENLGTF